MKRRSITLAVALVAISGLISASHLFNTAHAQSDRAQSEGVGAPEIIKHSMKEHGPDAFAATTGAFQSAPQPATPNLPGVHAAGGGQDAFVIKWDANLSLLQPLKDQIMMLQNEKQAYEAETTARINGLQRRQADLTVELPAVRHLAAFQQNVEIGA